MLYIRLGLGLGLGLTLPKISRSVAGYLPEHTLALGDLITTVTRPDAYPNTAKHRDI